MNETSRFSLVLMILMLPFFIVGVEKELIWLQIFAVTVMSIAGGIFITGESEE